MSQPRSALTSLSSHLPAGTRVRLITLLLAPVLAALAGAAPASALNSVLITKFAGNGTPGPPVAGPALSSGFDEPYALATDARGDVFVADQGNNAIEKITPAGTLSIIAGIPGSSGAPTPGRATESHLYKPAAVAVDSAGNVYIADEHNNEIEKVTPGGTLSIIAGGGTEAASTTPRAATSVKMFHPRGVAIDASGNVYVSDSSDYTIDKVTPGGMLSVVAGNYGSFSTHITPGPATATDLADPAALTFDSAGDLYICEAGQNAILKLTPAGTLSRIAGSPTGGYGAPTFGGPATSSDLYEPDGIAIDQSGDIFIADSYNFYVEEINTAGVISAVAGLGTEGTTVYGSVATSTHLYYPQGLAIDPSTGALYIGDWHFGAIDRIGTAAPGAPVEVTATLSGETATISFLAPTSYGTSAITGYEVSTDGGATWHTVTTTAGTGEALTAKVSGLTSSYYRFEVRAVNGSGAGPASSLVTVGTPPSTSSSSGTSSTSTTTATTTKQAQCLSSRAITVHWRLARGTKAGRITVRVDGKLYKTLPPSARKVLVSFAGRTGPAPVSVIVSTRTGGGRTLRTERSLHICTPAIAAKRPPSLYLVP